MELKTLPIQVIPNHISAAGQLSLEEMQALARQSFQAVVNLRGYGEAGASAEDERWAKAAGLVYGHWPVNPDNFLEANLEGLLKRLDDLPKPLLLYCRSGYRAVFVALLYAIAYQGLPWELALELGRSLGFDYGDKPDWWRWMKTFSGDAYGNR